MTTKMAQDEWRQYEKGILRLGLRARTEVEIGYLINTSLMSVLSEMILEGVQP